VRKLRTLRGQGQAQVNVYENSTKTVEMLIQGATDDPNTSFYLGKVTAIKTVNVNDGVPVPEGTDGISIVLKLAPSHGEFFQAEHWPIIRSAVEEALKELGK